jgi:hypothetical protein
MTRQQGVRTQGVKQVHGRQMRSSKTNNQTVTKKVLTLMKPEKTHLRALTRAKKAQENTLEIVTEKAIEAQKEALADIID